MTEIKLSIVIPAYNEMNRIRQTLTDVINWIKEKDYPIEVVVVNDGSTDKTEEVLKEYHSLSNFKVISYKNNKGKGYAVKVGMLESRGEIRLFMDADNSTRIEHFDLMVPLFKRGCDVVIGSRNWKDIEGAEQVKSQIFIKRWMGYLGNYVVRRVLALPFYDTQCGFKAFKEHAAVLLFRELKTYGWAFDMEILKRAQIMGFKIGVIPVKWYNKEGSKVKPLDYIKTFVDALKIRQMID